jgi:hypothetical protein
VDIVVFVALVTAFALLVTLHVALVFRLRHRVTQPRSLVLPPLAPYWGMEPA